MPLELADAPAREARATLQVPPGDTGAVYLAADQLWPPVAADNELLTRLAELALVHQQRPVAPDYGGGLQGEIYPA